MRRGKVACHVGGQCLALGHHARKLVELDILKSALLQGLDAGVYLAHGPAELGLALVGSNTDVAKRLVSHACYQPPLFVVSACPLNIASKSRLSTTFFEPLTR